MRRYTAHHQFQYPHGLELLRGLISSHSSRMHSFNALMGLSCYANTQKYTKQSEEFQCPLGLIPHFYKAEENDHEIDILVSMPSRAYTSFLPINTLYRYLIDFCVNALSGLYLISTMMIMMSIGESIIMCQCPLGLIPHFYRKKKLYP